MIAGLLRLTAAYNYSTSCCVVRKSTHTFLVFASKITELKYSNYISSSCSPVKYHVMCKISIFSNCSKFSPYILYIVTFPLYEMEYHSQTSQQWLTCSVEERTSAYHFSVCIIFYFLLHSRDNDFYDIPLSLTKSGIQRHQN